MKLFLVSCFFLLFHSSFGQNYVPFNAARLEVDKKLMVGLGTWASTNFVVSGMGWSQAKSTELMYFHQMNVLWNVVNIGLAVPGYLKANKAKTDLSYEETLREQKKTEKIFLINTCVDVAYVTSGYLLLNKSKELGPFEQRQSGYGKSLLLQGGFLFVFDLTAYLTHKSQGNKGVNAYMGSIGASPSGIGLSWNIPPVTLNHKHRFL